MSMQVTKVQVWAGEIENRPGGLADILDELAAAGANLQCVIARREPHKPEAGMLYVTPIRGKLVERAAGAVGLKPAQDVPTLRVEGQDRPGLGSRLTRAVADTHVSMRGVSAAVMGNRFVGYLGFDREEDADLAARAIRAMDPAPARGRKTASRKSTGARSGKRATRRRKTA